MGVCKRIYTLHLLNKSCSIWHLIYSQSLTNTKQVRLSVDSIKRIRSRFTNSGAVIEFLFIRLNQIFLLSIWSILNEERHGLKNGDIWTLCPPPPHPQPDITSFSDCIFFPTQWNKCFVVVILFTRGKILISSNL